jgi:hypothetical protein
MKKIFFSLFVLASFLTPAVAQAPQKINYQGIARNSAGQPLANQAIGLRISILDGSAVGTPVYVETFTVNTNAYGLYTLAIGSGSVVSGNISATNWASADKYMKVEIDPAGGTAYIALGTSQLLSVPYALRAEDAGKITVYGSGTQNTNKMIIQHSPAYPGWGLQYSDSLDKFRFLSNGYNVTEVDLGARKLLVNGSLQITSGTPGNGKILSSDASGNATWMDMFDNSYIFQSGTANSNKYVFKHSPAYPTWGLMYQDTLDQFQFVRGGTSIVGIDLGGMKLDVNYGLKISSNAGNGKVLTSDAAGNATWQDASTKVSAFQPVGCQSLANATGSFQKIANMGTFSKSVAGTLIELDLQTNVYAATLASGTNGIVYELRVDDNATTFGNATALIRNAGSYEPVTITGIFSGLDAGTHTVSLWAKATNNGSATSVMYDAGCFNSAGTNNVLVKEFK